ncbi:hypothetical protein SPURM210S_05829 [Streptomyces purpurascens]
MASVVRTSTATNRTITPTTASTWPVRPNVSLRKSVAFSISIQSRTRSKGRASTW